MYTYIIVFPPALVRLAKANTTSRYCMYERHKLRLQSASDLLSGGSYEIDLRVLPILSLLGSGQRILNQTLKSKQTQANLEQKKQFLHTICVFAVVRDV